MSIPVVYDCMLFFMRAARPKRVRETFQLVEENVVEYCLSASVLSEIHDVLTRSTHQRQFPALTADRVNAFLEDITRRARFFENVPDVYELQRDPKDSKYINLALAAEAPYLVTRDKDLLDLMNEAKSEGQDFQRRFRQLRIIEPLEFVREMERLKGMSRSEPS